MNDITLRVRKVFEETKKTQSEIARELNVTPAYIWKLLNNDNAVPSDRLIEDICEKMNISKEWLRTGNGLMQKPKKKEDELGEALAQIIKDDDPVIRSILIAYAKMNDDDRKAIKRMAESILKELQELKEE